MGSTGLYAKMPLSSLGGTSGVAPFNLLTANVNAALVTSAYTPTQATDALWSTPQADEASGTGYTAGGQSLTGKALATSGLVTTFTASNVTWTTSTITARYAVLYVNTGTASTSPLIADFDFGSNQSSSAQNFVISWNASGVFTETVGAFA